mgnify:CR=1 FL=1
MITISSIINLIQTVSRKIREDYVNVFSAQAAYYLIICVFPFGMFLLSLIQNLIHYLPITQEEILVTCSRIFPNTIDTFVSSIIKELYGKASATILSVTGITTLWSASRSFLAITRGLEKIYNITETRNYIVRRLLSAVYTLIFAVSLILLLVIFVFGNTLYGWIVVRLPFLADFTLLVISMRTLFGLAFLTLFFLLIYIFIPNRKTRVFNELPGALLSSAGWMGFSFLYSFYIDNMSNFSSMYGSLTAVVLCMIWLYACMLILFLGAELNALLATPSFRGSLLTFLRSCHRRNKAKKAARKKQKAESEGGVTH